MKELTKKDASKSKRIKAIAFILVLALCITMIPIISMGSNQDGAPTGVMKIVKSWDGEKHAVNPLFYCIAFADKDKKEIPLNTTDGVTYLSDQIAIGDYTVVEYCPIGSIPKKTSEWTKTKSNKEGFDRYVFNQKVNLKANNTLVVDNDDGITWEPLGTNGNPYGSANYFSVLAFNDITVRAADVEGGLAIGGNFNLELAGMNTYGFGQPEKLVGLPIAPHNPRLLVKGNINGPGKRIESIGGSVAISKESTVNLDSTKGIGVWEYIGKDSYYSKYNGMEDFNVTYPEIDSLRKDSAKISSFFSQAETALKGLSASYKSIKGDNVYTTDVAATIPRGDVTLNTGDVDLTNIDTIVYNLSCVKDIKSVLMTIPNSYDGRIIINVDASSGTASFVNDAIVINGESQDAWGLGREYSDRIVWNFPKQTRIESGGYAIIGSVLAPTSDFIVVGGGGNINGMLVINNLSQQGGWEVHTTTKFGRTNNVPKAQEYLEVGNTIGGDGPKLGDIKITKTDISDSAIDLTGGEFKLTNQTGEIELTTSAVDGDIIFSNLPWDTYKFEEVEAPAGYEKGSLKFEDGFNKDAIVITSSSLNIIADATNTKILGEISLTKYESGTTDPLDGVEFKLLKLEGDTWTDTGRVETTGETGTVTFSGLEWGDYRIEETNAKAGFDKDTFRIKNVSDENYSEWNNFQVTVDENTQKFVLEGTNNKEGRGSFELTKLDVEDKVTGLNGGEFKLTKDDDPTFEKTSTAKDGIVAFDDLEYGTYTVSEVRAPKGYKDNSLTFAGNDTATVVVSESTPNPTLTAYNEKLYGSITMEKVDVVGSGDDAKLRGGEFGLKQAGTADDKIIATAEAIDGVVSFPKVELGEYEIVEITAPQGYDGKLLYSSFDGIYEITEEDLHLTQTGYNGRILGTLEIQKLDQDDNKKAIKGAVFSLMIPDGNDWKDYEKEGVVVTATTDENGKAVFTDLPWNTYKVVEIGAPTGYVENSLTFETGQDGTFVVDSEIQEVPLKAFNKASTVLGTVETTPVDNSSVLGDDEDPEDSKVLGDEAKTSDPMNMVPLLAIMLLVMLILLAVASRARKE